MIDLSTPRPITPRPSIATPDVSTPHSTASKRDVADFHAFQERCRNLCLALLAGPKASIRSLGFTSSIAGEGKTFLASVTAAALANDIEETIVLAECNWEHPTMHEYFGIAPGPGLAEWARGECPLNSVRHQFGDNLIVVPAGDGRSDAVRLLQRLQLKPLRDKFTGSHECLILDLPSIMSTGYGALAASLVEALLVVVRAGATPKAIVAEACAKLEGLPINGLLLNQMDSKIPQWLGEML